MLGPGPNLALLLLGSYRKLLDAVVAELAVRGYEDARPSHDFAMRAIESGADTASELGRALSVSKQAAAKTVAALVDRGYAVLEDDPADGRRRRIRVTAEGRKLMREGERIFDELRAEWARQIGPRKLTELEKQLAAFVGDSRIRLDAPGWVSRYPE